MGLKSALMLILFAILSTDVYGQDNICPQYDQEALPRNIGVNALNQRYLTVMSLEQAQGYMNWLKSYDDFLVYDFMVEGCETKVYYGAALLNAEDRNVFTFRVDAEPDRASFSNPEYIVSSEVGSRSGLNLTVEGTTEFSYHTGLGVCVKNAQTGRVEPYIIDPTFYTSPQPIHSWVHGLEEETNTFNTAQFQIQSSRIYYSSMYTLDRTKRSPRTFVERDKDKAKSKLLCQNRMFARWKQNPREPFINGHNGPGGDPTICE